MRMILLLSAVTLSAGASAAPPQLAPSPALNAQSLAGALQGKFDTSPVNKDDSRANCRGRIETAREERGLPKLTDDGAKPSEPLFIAAVDKLIDGCEVLVMRDNTSDIRPLPEFHDGPGKLTPLGGQ